LIRGIAVRTIVLVAALAAASCGNGPVPVRGRVTLDGTPVAGATVTFVPVGPRGHPASAPTDANGVFRLTTFKQEDGALRGEYKVIVTKSDALPPPPAAEPGNGDSVKNHYKALKSKRTSKEALPPVYADSAKTPLRCSVPPDGEVTLSLESKAK
jgi:hypothetical protein